MSPTGNYSRSTTCFRRANSQGDAELSDDVDHPVDKTQKLFGGVGLRQRRTTGVMLAGSVIDGFTDQSAGGYHTDFRTDSFQRTDHGFAVHDRHIHIRNYQSNLVPVLDEDGNAA